MDRLPSLVILCFALMTGKRAVFGAERNSSALADEIFYSHLSGADGCSSGVSAEGVDFDVSIGHFFAPGEELQYSCRGGYSDTDPGQRNVITCTAGGEWSPSVDSLCSPLSARCRRPHVVNSAVDQHAELFPPGARVLVSCKPGYILPRVPPSTAAAVGPASQVELQCNQYGRWQVGGAVLLTDVVRCERRDSRGHGCPRPIDDGITRFTYYPLPSEDGIEPGTRVQFECGDPNRFYLEGEVEFVCAADGRWNPPVFPSCREKRACPRLGAPDGGFYRPVDENGYFVPDDRAEFRPGVQQRFACDSGLDLEGPEALHCLVEGRWSGDAPTCSRREIFTRRSIVILSVGALIGLLLAIILAFVLQRQYMIRKARSQQSRHPEAATPVDPDRLALIAFAEGLGLPPPYEEAVAQRRGPPPFDAVSTLSGFASRAARRLPSLSSLRSSREIPPRRLSNENSPSNIGSNDTMPSDVGTTTGTSGASVTLETVSSGRSTTQSVQAQAGSLNSVVSTAAHHADPAHHHPEAGLPSEAVPGDGESHCTENKAS